MTSDAHDRSSGRAAFIEPETRYDFGPDHPMAPGRVARTLALARAYGVLDAMDTVIPAPLAEELLLSVHTADYVAAVRGGGSHPQFGLGTSDNPVRPLLHEISSAVVAGTVEAARRVYEGSHRRAVNVAGGLHHAMPGGTSGFCVYNDVGIAIRWLLDAGVDKIAYLDVDAHHGDGVQEIFADEPRVLTVSLHQSPVELFPGTGFPTETGGLGAPGSAVNLALPGRTGDAGWLRAFHAVVPEALAAFGPDVVVSQHGCDSHVEDPLTDLALTVDGQRDSYLAIADLADHLAGGRWVAVGGGGYAIDRVVPRAWTHLLAIVAGRPIPVDTPIPAEIRAELGPSAPETMSDLPPDEDPQPGGRRIRFASVEAGWDPASRLDQAILATRRAVFPELGLDAEV